MISFYRVQYGKIEDFIKTSCLTSLSFIQTSEDGKGRKNSQKKHQKTLIKIVRILKKENENSVFEFMESMNSPVSPNDLKSYRMSMINNNHNANNQENSLNSANKQHSNSSSLLGKSRGTNIDSSIIGLSTMQQNRSKKLGAIMGIAKRSRSIHNPDWCPSKNNSFLLGLL